MNTLNRRLAAISVCLLGIAVPPAWAANFVVTTNADSGTGSLRWALQQAALTPLSMDTITFNLPANELTISPLTSLPNVFYTNLDARTQPGYAGAPIVRIDGSSNTSVTSQHGFGLGNNGLVAGFSIVNFRDYGILSIASAATPAVTMANYIGVQPDGVTAGPNGVGIWVNNTASIIGGVGAGLGNVISGNTNAGIDLWTSATDNHISNNYIGTTADGLAALPNGTHGVHVRGTANLIGDVNADERNIISGNTESGVYIENANNAVLGNWIGLNVAGNALPNKHGVLTYGNGTRIGDGVQPGGGNVISGNTLHGVYARFVDGVFVEANRIGTDPTGLLDRGNGGQGVYIDASTNASIGGASASFRNVICGNGSGVYIGGVPPHASVATANVERNYIGLGIDGTTAIGNDNGILTYAGEIAIANNVVSASTSRGIYLRGGDLVIEDNLIGTNAAGTSARANGTGIDAGDATKMHLERNIIAGNGSGMSISGALVEATIVDNRFGVTAADAKLANTGSNIRVVTAKPGLVIGAPGKGNRIGASLRGIYLDPTSEGVIIQSNYIGWIPGTPGKDIGHTETAILGAGSNHQIGGSAPSERNVISKNTSTGIHLGGSGHRIQGNLIGSDPSGTPAIGNRNGVVLDDAFNVLLGGTGNEANYIRNNQDAGVRVRGQGVAMLSNRIYGNGQIPIDLIGVAGPEANDSGDLDPGTNGLQNHPIIESASISGANTLIQGRLEARPNANYTVQFFSAAACHSSGLGDAQGLIGTTNVLTNGLGAADIFYTGPTSTGAVSATATDALGNTSEIGNCVTIGAVSAGQFRFTQSIFWGYEINGVLNYQVTRSGGSFGATSVTISTQNQSAIAGSDYTAVTQTIQFAPGETLKSGSIPLADDGVIEGYETFLVNLSNPTGGATLGASTQATAYIVSNDSGTIRVSSSDITISEPASGQAMAVFTVTMDAHVGERTVSFTTESGSATTDVDFIATSGELVFAEGETSKTISVPVKADAVIENPEYFLLRLSETETDVGLVDTVYYANIENTGGAPTLFNDSFE